MEFFEFRKFQIVLVLLMTSGVLSHAQFSPRAHYNFDGMDLTEATGNYGTGTAMSTAFYDCGVGFSSSALIMTGNPDTISLDPKVKEIFSDDFSLSFYFRADDSGLAVGDNIGYSLFSIQNNCNRDSSLNIRYVGIGGADENISQVSLEYAADVSEAVRFNHNLNTDFCWHQLVFTKSGTTYNLYIDGEFVESRRFLNDISLGENFPVYVGFSDCVGGFDDAFRGRIDEIRFYDQAITQEYVVASKRFPDQIISRDTTLFEGDSYDILTGSSCAPDIIWSPVNGLNDPFSLNPVATPNNTTTYTIEFNHGTCVSSDTVRISIIKDENIDCENLLLPKAFTPNRDNLNDEYGISNKFIISDIQRFEIYDRWGMKLFEGNTKDDQWNGQYMGQNMMPGTYVYKIEYTCLGNNYQKTASFNLIK